MVERNWGDRLAAIHPTIMALLLAALAWPIVALTLDARVLQDVSRFSRLPPPAALPADDIGRWAAAAGAVFASALVAAPLGAALVRRDRNRAAAVTFLLAAIVGSTALPVLPTLLGRAVGFGYGCGSSFGAYYDCAYALTNPLEGFLYPLLFALEWPLIIIVVIANSMGGGRIGMGDPSYGFLSLLLLSCGVCVWTLAVREVESHRLSKTETGVRNRRADASAAAQLALLAQPVAGTAAPEFQWPPFGWPPSWRTWRWTTRVFAVWTGLAALGLVGYGFVFVGLTDRDGPFGLLVVVFPAAIGLGWLLLAVPGFTLLRFFRWLIPPLVTGARAHSAAVPSSPRVR